MKGPFIYVQSARTIKFVDNNGKVRRVNRADLPPGHPARVVYRPRRRRRLTAEQEALYIESLQK